jgi:hypothetical protein
VIGLHTINSWQSEYDSSNKPVNLQISVNAEMTFQLAFLTPDLDGGKAKFFAALIFTGESSNRTQFHADRDCDRVIAFSNACSSGLLVWR